MKAMNKRTCRMFSVLLAFTMLLSIFSGALPAEWGGIIVQAADTMIFSEDFSSMTPGQNFAPAAYSSSPNNAWTWYTEKTAGTSITVENENINGVSTNYVHINKTDVSGNSAAYIYTGNTFNGKLTVKYKARTDVVSSSNAPQMCNVLDGNNAGNIAANIKFNNGYITQYNTNLSNSNTVNNTNGTAYTADGWNDIVLVLDYSTKKVDVYVNGVQRGKTIGFRSGSASKAATVKFITTGGPGYVDFAGLQIVQDGAAPSLASAVTDTSGSQITLTFSEVLNSMSSILDASRFSLEGTGASIASAAFDPDDNIKINLNLNGNLLPADSIKLNILPGNGIQDASGNGGINITNYSVTNLVTQPEVIAPSVISQNNQLYISWINPNFTGFAGVNVCSTVTGAVYETIHQPAHTTTIAGLVNGVTYSFRLVTIDSLGNQSTGIVVSGIPSNVPDISPPGDVTGVSVSAPLTGGQLSLSWSNPLDGDFYKTNIYDTVSGTVYQTVYAPANSTIVSELTNGLQYSFRLKAADVVGNEAPGVVISGTPIDLTPPATVTDVTVAPHNGQLNLSWTNPTDSDFQKVNIYDTATNQICKTVYAPASGTVITGLTNGLNYSFRTKTADVFGNESSQSVTITGTPNYTVQGVALSSSSAVMLVGDTLQLTPSLLSDGEVFSGSALLSGTMNFHGIALASGDPSIALIDSWGMITAKKAGTVTIRATSLDNTGAFNECTLTVQEPILTVPPVFTDGQGTLLTGLEPSSVINIAETVTNRTLLAQNITLIVVLYDSNGTVKSYRTAAKEVTAGATEVLHTSVDTPSSVNGYSLKVFVWDDLNEMRPIAEGTVIAP